MLKAKTTFRSMSDLLYINYQFVRLHILMMYQEQSCINISIVLSYQFVKLQDRSDGQISYGCHVFVV